MSDYFTNAEDLGLWVKDRPTADEAAKELISIMGNDKPVAEDDIVATCRSIFNGNDQNASSILFGILAKHNITTMRKRAQSDDDFMDFSGNSERVMDLSTKLNLLDRKDLEDILAAVSIQSFPNETDDDLRHAIKTNVADGTLTEDVVDYFLDKEASSNALKKQAQSKSRQRNGWVRGMRNKWNRCVDGFNEGTPWRIDRDKMYDFTHYYTDAITFDEDPNRVYSGEAIWRSYIMDKYSREYQDKEGHWVGGYINDRFYVFPDAGTPANPKVARDGGNLLGLAPGERTRKPRPHQYSTERRLEEARGVKTTDLEANASTIKPIAKIASANLPKERHEDVVYNIFRDTIDMREAGFGYEDMIQKISEHYDVALTSVAQIDATAQRLVHKHSGVFYGLEKKAQFATRNTFVVQSQLPVMSNGKEVFIQPETTVVSLGGNRFEALNDPNLKQFEFVGQVPQAALRSLDAESGGEFPIQEAAEDLGLSEKKIANQPPMEADNDAQKGFMDGVANQDSNFEVTEQ